METLTYRRQANGITKVDMEEFFDDVEIDSLYQWIDRIPLSRPKKNITKDFSDGGEYFLNMLNNFVQLCLNVPVLQKKNMFSLIFFDLDISSVSLATPYLPLPP